MVRASCLQNPKWLNMKAISPCLYISDTDAWCLCNIVTLWNDYLWRYIFLTQKCFASHVICCWESKVVILSPCKWSIFFIISTKLPALNSETLVETLPFQVTPNVLKYEFHSIYRQSWILISVFLQINSRYLTTSRITLSLWGTLRSYRSS